MLRGIETGDETPPEGRNKGIEEKSDTKGAEN